MVFVSVPVGFPDLMSLNDGLKHGIVSQIDSFLPKLVLVKCFLTAMKTNQDRHLSLIWNNFID